MTASAQTRSGTMPTDDDDGDDDQDDDDNKNEFWCDVWCEQLTLNTL
jgi:hypothetical protein